MEELPVPELLVTPTNINDILPLIEAGADAFVIGEMRYGLRLAGEFNKADIKNAVEIAHNHKRKVYVAMNAIFHNEKVEELDSYLQFLQEIAVDAVVFGDPAVLMAAKQSAPNIRLHWSTETLGTNWYTCNYWGRKGAKRAVLARELSMDEILEIKENAEVEIEILVHGMSCMFQSKRPLIDNYFQFQGKQMEVRQSGQGYLFLYDPERDNKYPVFEDENGTHIMSANDICIIDELQELVDAGIDSFKIDGIFQSPQYIIEVTKLYRKAIDLCVHDSYQYEEEKDQLLEKIIAMQPQNRGLDTGFFFKETVY